MYSIVDVQQDPHFRARGTMIDLQDPLLGAIPVPAAVPRFTGRVAGIPCVGPDTGQDNAQVYGALGVTEQQLVSLHERKVI